MKTSVKYLPKSRVELIVELSPDEMKPYQEQAAKSLSYGTKIAGFRPGKAPYDLVEREVGAMKILQEAAEKAIERSFTEAIVEHKLVTVGPPQVALEKLAPGNLFSYKATVSVLPQVELTDYRKVKANKREVKVETKEIDETVTNLRKMYGKEKLVTRPARQGDKIEIDLDTYMDKVPIDGGTSKNHPVVIGEGHFIPGFEESVIDMATGQTKEFQLKFPKTYHRKDLAGQPVDFKVKVNSVFEIELPAVDDSFAKMLGQFEKLDDMRAQIEQSIHRDKSAKEQQRWELEIINYVITKSSFGELPAILMETELHKMMHELEHEVTGEGMKFEDYLQSIKKSKEELQAEFRPQAEKRIKTALVLREIATKEHIQVSDDELEKEINIHQKQYENKPEIAEQLKKPEYRDYLRNILRSQKVFEFLDKKGKG
ncbi:MAG: trigger factor [Patescibacteria group bacterium]